MLHHQVSPPLQHHIQNIHVVEYLYIYIFNAVKTIYILQDSHMKVPHMPHRKIYCYPITALTTSEVDLMTLKDWQLILWCIDSNWHSQTCYRWVNNIKWVSRELGSSVCNYWHSAVFVWGTLHSVVLLWLLDQVSSHGS